jgi:hypothetical protein
MTRNEKVSVLQKALGESWSEMNDTIKLHYDLKPGGVTELHMQGIMHEVYHSWIGKLYLLPGRLFGALVPYQGKNIPTEVRNRASCNRHCAMHWHRQLTFPGKKPVIFQSRMVHHQGSEIIEYVGYGLGIRLHVFTQDGALHYRSRGYLWKVGSLRLRLPNWLILGEAEIVEKAISEKDLSLDFNIRHPWFGKTFSYSGHFRIEKFI